MHYTFSFFYPTAFFDSFCSISCSLPSLFFSSASLLFHQPPLQCLLPASSSHGGTPFPFVEPGALLACIGMTVTDEERWGAEAGGNITFECPPLPAVREGQQGGGDLLPPQKSLWEWTSAPGRGRVKPQSSSLFSLQHPPSLHSQQLASFGHWTRLPVACPE